MKRKLLFTALALLICLPMTSQSLLRHRNKTSKTNVSYVSPLSMAKRSATAERIQPKNSVLVESISSLTIPDTLTYDRHGNSIERINDQRYKDVWEYDTSGQMLINRYEASRKDVNVPWEIITGSYTRRTTLNNNGIRTAIEDEDYSEIILNNKGLVTSYKGKIELSDNEEGTQTWDGNLLKSLTAYSKDNQNNETSSIQLNDIEIIFSYAPFNPYQISYLPYLIGIDTDDWDWDSHNLNELPYIFFFNAKGKVEATVDGITIKGDITFQTQITDPKDGISYPCYFMNLNISNNGKEQRLIEFYYCQIDKNGSFELRQTDYQDYVQGTYTFTYDNQGNITKEELTESEIDENGNAIDGRNNKKYFRYNWQYDADGKPLKVETYYASNNSDETLSSTETFTAWYDASAINNVVTDTAKILGATLYTINGTPVRNLIAEEVEANKIEVQQKGIYLLIIKTDKGIETRKIIR